MLLVPTPEQRLFQETARQFLESEMPLTRVRELHDAGIGFEPDWWRRAAELGWTSMLVSTELGGGSLSGQGLVDVSIAAEEMGRLCTPGPLLVTNAVASALCHAQQPSDHVDLINGLLAGDLVATWAVDEPKHGWNPYTPTTSAVRADNGWRLTGTKERVECADQADYILTSAETESGPIQLVVPANAPGVSITPLRSLDLVRHYADVTFENVQLPAASIVSNPDTYVVDIDRQNQIAAVLQSAETAGAVNYIFDVTVQWAFDRYSFGRPLASYQALKHRFADMKMWLETCHATVTAAARAIADGSEDSNELASVAMSYVGTRATDIVQDCVQMHGGIGVTWEHDIHIYLRRVTVNRVNWGTPYDHRRRIADLLSV